MSELAGGRRKIGTCVDTAVEYLAKQDVGYACRWMLGQHTLVLWFIRQAGLPQYLGKMTSKYLVNPYLSNNCTQVLHVAWHYFGVPCDGEIWVPTLMLVWYTKLDIMLIFGWNDVLMNIALRECNFNEYGVVIVWPDSILMFVSFLVFLEDHPLANTTTSYHGLRLSSTLLEIRL